MKLAAVMEAGARYVLLHTASHLLRAASRLQKQQILVVFQPGKRAAPLWGAIRPLHAIACQLRPQTQPVRTGFGRTCSPIRVMKRPMRLMRVAFRAVCSTPFLATRSPAMITFLATLHIQRCQQRGHDQGWHSLHKPRETAPSVAIGQKGGNEACCHTAESEQDRQAGQHALQMDPVSLRSCALPADTARLTWIWELTVKDRTTADTMVSASCTASPESVACLHASPGPSSMRHLAPEADPADPPASSVLCHSLSPVDSHASRSSQAVPEEGGLRVGEVALDTCLRHEALLLLLLLPPGQEAGPCRRQTGHTAREQLKRISLWWQGCLSG